jgi:FixJ family two-component response regulator
MNSGTVPDHATKASATSHATPAVFVVDDDVSMRESLKLLIRFAGWAPETFEAAQEFLSRPRVLVPSCLILDVALLGLNGLRPSAIAMQRQGCANNDHVWTAPRGQGLL